MIDAINNIKPSENGPNILPIPPNNKKSPPPMPSFFVKILKIRFNKYKEINPNKNPYRENIKLEIPSMLYISVIKIPKNIFVLKPTIMRKRFIYIGR
mgnify:FL=1